MAQAILELAVYIFLLRDWKKVVEKERKGLLYYYECAALIAIEIMLAFSAWGYVKLEYVSITFVPVVVLAMAYLLGPWD